MHYSSCVLSGALRRSWYGNVLVHTQTPFAPYSGSLPRAGDPRWEFGRRVNSGWQRLLHLPEEPYSLDLAKHAGVIVGLSEEGVHMSQLRLAVNAARHGWKVVMFDPQSSEKKAAEFVAAMRQAGNGNTYVYPGTGTTESTFTARADRQRLHLAIPSSVMDDALQIMLSGNVSLQGIGAQLIVPRSFYEFYELLGPVPQQSDAPPTTTPYDCANAVYLGLNVWEGTQEVRRTARALLSDFTRFLSTSEAQHVLLLIEHPALLFDMEEVCPLFALLEQTQGSMFVSARSVADFGKEAPRLLKNARTLIAHRSSTTLPFEPYVSLPWWSHHPFFDGVIRQFSSDECFVIHAGQATHVRVKPVFIDADGFAGVRVQPRPPTDSHGSAIDLDIDDDELEELLASVFGPEDPDDDESEQAFSSPPVRPTRKHSPKEHTRSAELLSDDLAHLRNALSLLGREK